MELSSRESRTKGRYSYSSSGQFRGDRRSPLGERLRDKRRRRLLAEAHPLRHGSPGGTEQGLQRDRAGSGSMQEAADGGSILRRRTIGPRLQRNRRAKSSAARRQADQDDEHRQG